MKKWIVNTLLRLYPASWRREYGPELMDMLLARPLSLGIAGDILWNATQQRVREAEPSTFLGLVLMLLVAIRFVQDELIVSHQTSNLYVLFLMGSGLWTHLRHEGRLSRSGRAAVKLSFIAGIPVMLAGLLMLFGILGVRTAQDYCWIRVSDASSPLQGIQRAMCPPAPLGVALAPLFILPASWMWGLAGGALARQILRIVRRPTTY